MMRASVVLAVLLGWLLVPSSVAADAAAGTLPEPVARVARALGVPHSAISLWIQEIGAPQPLAVHLPDTPRTPASTLKLVATFAALQGLTPAYRWRTELYALGPLEGGRLAGDLLLRGGGDPYLVQEEFWKLVGDLHRQGLHRIDGDLVFDSSYFDLPPESPADFDGRPDRLYNLLPHPLLVNFNAMRFEFEPADGAVAVWADPPLPGLRIQNRLRLQPGACTGYQRGIALNVLEPPRRDQVLLEGAFPTGCQRFALTRSVLQPESYAFGLFEKYFRQLGGEIAGQWRSGILPEAWSADDGQRLRSVGDDNGPDRHRAGGLLHVHYSRPLGELVRMVNKYSNNVMTRHLELTLGAERFGPPATPEKGRAATLEILAEHGVDTRDMVIDNPSGLSREARLSARQLARLLLAAWDAPYMPEFVSSLALSGLDGTLRRRLQEGPEVGRMHLKTGSLDHVSAIAGYVQTADNRRLVVVVIVNAADAHRGPGEEIQDAALRWAFGSPRS